MTEAPEPSARSLLATGGCLYFAMLAGALFWLDWRDRLAAVPERAIGEHGIWISAGIGLAAGLGAAAILALASRASVAVRGCELRVATLLGPMPDRAVLGLALLSAVAEEFFFRLAVQDALGMPAAVALYVVLNTGPGFWAWAPVALASGLLFSGLVALGCGLLAATVAHAVMTYLALQRILTS